MSEYRGVLFSVAGAEYVIAADRVVEIAIAGEIIPVPGSPPYIPGVIQIRTRIVPVIDLCQPLGLGNAAGSIVSTVIIVRVQECLIGLGVESARELVRIPEQFIQQASALTAQAARPFMQGLARVDGRLLIILDVDHLLGEGTLVSAVQVSSAAGISAPADILREGGDGVKKALGGQRKLISFSLGREAYGVDVAHVLEILRPQPLMPLPHCVGYLRGLINVRGRIIPVIDLHQLLQLEALGDAGEKRFVVLHTAGHTVVAQVDRLFGLVRLSPDNLHVQNAGNGRPQAQYCHEVADVDGWLISVMNMQLLLHETARRQTVASGVC